MIGLIYLRVSTDDQESGLEMQRAITKKVCDKLDIKIVDTYEDVAISGASRNRQGLKDLKAKIAKLADSSEEIAIIVYDISRIARDMTIGEEIIQLCKKNKVAIVDSTGKITRINGWADSAFIRFQFMMSTTGKEIKNEDAINGMSQALNQGRWIFQAPKGYKYEMKYHEKLGIKCKTLVFNYESEIIKEALEGFASDIFKSPNQVREFILSKNAKIEKANLKQFLTNPLYAGKIEYPTWKVSFREGVHQPLISMETYQKILDKFEIKTENGYTVNSIEDFALRRHIKCNECEGWLTGCWVKGRDRKYKSYFCQNKKCKYYHKHMNGDKLEAKFVELLESIKLPNYILETAKESFELASQLQLKSLENTKKEGLNEVKKIDRQITNLWERLKDCEIEIIAKKYELEIADLEKQKVILSAHLKELANSEIDTQTKYRTTINRAMVMLEKPDKMWLLGSLELKRLLFNIVFEEYIFVCPNDLYPTARFSLIYQLFSQFENQKKVWWTNPTQISNVIETKLLNLVKSIHPHVQHVEKGEWDRVFDILNLVIN